MFHSANVDELMDAVLLDDTGTEGEKEQTASELETCGDPTGTLKSS
ncbi:hypothetical protein GR183_07095 [Stappia sp. GBMRC 2046]|uniref:Uncharacterized protein n=1 Tax=Stappia sediminis TaxID=2692190 RepID=A0A7X3S7D8_9HYPH|nr:hypothetical protein [Stappia sediminis]MXN64666.1 hypothetical protein [Stappia sediminis]